MQFWGRFLHSWVTDSETELADGIDTSGETMSQICYGGFCSSGWVDGLTSGSGSGNRTTGIKGVDLDTLIVT